MDLIIEAWPYMYFGAGLIAAAIHDYDRNGRNGPKKKHIEDTQIRDFAIGTALFLLGPLGLVGEWFLQHKNGQQL